MRVFERLHKPEPFTETTAAEHSYERPGEPTVTVVPESDPVPADVVARLIETTGLHQYTADQIVARQAALLQTSAGEADEATRAEQSAVQLLMCLTKAIDASAVSKDPWVRLDVGTLGNETITRQAIGLAAAAMAQVDPDHLRVIPCWGSNSQELSAIDVVLPQQYDLPAQDV